MSNIFLLISCLLIGIILRGVKALPDNAPLTLNALIVNVFVPAITLRYGSELDISTDFFLPILAAWLVFGFAFLFFNFTKKYTGFDRETIGALIVVAGISSISFVGFPIFELLYGAEGLKVGIVMSQAGTFVVCSTAGILVVSVYAEKGETLNWAKIFKDILRFPPFIAFCTAIVLKMIGFHPPSLFSAFLEKLGNPMSVAALLSIGLQMDFTRDKSQMKALKIGLFFKLILAPLFIFIVFFVFLKQSNIAAKVSVVGSTLGSMNTIGIVAIRKGLNPPLITKMLAISIPLSLILVPIVYYFLEHLLL
jgi:malate permease and related proteins